MALRALGVDLVRQFVDFGALGLLEQVEFVEKLSGEGDEAASDARQALFDVLSRHVRVGHVASLLRRLRIEGVVLRGESVPRTPTKVVIQERAHTSFQSRTLSSGTG